MGVYRHEWQPGNATRYDIIYSCYSEENSDGEMESWWIISWMLEGWAGGKTFRCRTDDFINYTYLLEKMDINEGDAPGILSFMEELGIRVGYPLWFEKSRFNQKSYAKAREAFGSRGLDSSY